MQLRELNDTLYVRSAKLFAFPLTLKLSQCAVLVISVHSVLILIIYDIDLGGEYGNNLLYAGIKVHTTMTMGSLGYKKGLVTHDAWEEFVNQKVLTFFYTWVPPKASAELKSVVCFFRKLFVGQPMQELSSKSYMSP